MKKILKFLSIGASLLMLILLLHYRRSNELIANSKDKFFDNPPDLILVFTGDTGRIQRAPDLSKQYPESKILISGVYSKNNLLILLNKYFPNENKSEKLLNDYSMIIELDFKAKNTEGNVRESLIFLEENMNYKDILVISSDYHLPRVDFLFSFLKEPKNDHLNIHYESPGRSLFFDYLTKSFWEFIKFINFIFQYCFA
jgi:uncharacterized SAM-binding protein YcdF (DUF218 family)